MKHLFHLKETEDNEFFANLVELLFDLENSLGTPEQLEETAKQMANTAVRIDPLQKQNFERFANFFTDVRQMLRQNEQEFYDNKYMLRSFVDGRVLIEQDKNTVHYFDHPYHQEYFKQLNIKPCTETK